MQVLDERQSQTYLLSMDPLEGANGPEKQSGGSPSLRPESTGTETSKLPPTAGIGCSGEIEVTWRRGSVGVVLLPTCASKSGRPGMGPTSIADRNDGVLVNQSLPCPCSGISTRRLAADVQVWEASNRGGNRHFISGQLDESKHRPHDVLDPDLGRSC